MCEPHARDHLLNFVLIFENIRLYQRYLVKVVIDGTRQLLYIKIFQYFEKIHFVAHLQCCHQGLQCLCSDTLLLLELKLQTLILLFPLIQLSLIENVIIFVMSFSVSQYLHAVNILLQKVHQFAQRMGRLGQGLY